MELYIHYTALPEGMDLKEVLTRLDETLDEDGFICGGQKGTDRSRIDLELEDERINPKLAQIAVKNCLKNIHFPQDTTIEIGGMEIGLYE